MVGSTQDGEFSQPARNERNFVVWEKRPTAAVAQTLNGYSGPALCRGKKNAHITWILRDILLDRKPAFIKIHAGQTNLLKKTRNHTRDHHHQYLPTLAKSVSAACMIDRSKREREKLQFVFPARKN